MCPFARPGRDLRAASSCDKLFDEGDFVRIERGRRRWGLSGHQRIPQA
jgi:hypothetical protein